MKYIVMDERKDGTGDFFNDEYATAEEAIKVAKWKWSYLTAKEKKERTIWVLESANPDEEAENYFDGNPIFTAEED